MVGGRATLKLTDGFNFSTSVATAFMTYSTNGSTTLNVTGTASISTVNTTSKDVIGIACYHSSGYEVGMWITGTGTLNVNTGNVSGTGAVTNTGIYVGPSGTSGDLYIDGAKVNVTCGTASSSGSLQNYGIYVRVGEFDARNGAVVTVKAGNVISTRGSAESAGIVTYGDMAIGQGSDVQAEGGTATSTSSSASSYGMHIDGESIDNISVYSNGKCKAEGKAATGGSNADSSGMFSSDKANGVSASGTATIEAIAGKATASTNAFSDGIWMGEVSCKDQASITSTGGNANTTTTQSNDDAYAESSGLHITDWAGDSFQGGTITATAGNVYVTNQDNLCESYGIIKENEGLSFYNGVTVKATAGSASGNAAQSIGLCALENTPNVYFDEGDITAIGGTVSGTNSASYGLAVSADGTVQFDNTDNEGSSLDLKVLLRGTTLASTNAINKDDLINEKIKVSKAYDGAGKATWDSTKGPLGGNKSGTQTEEYKYIEVSPAAAEKSEVSISGISVSDKTYDGAVASYSGTPSAKLKSDPNTNVVFRAGDYVYTWKNSNGTVLSSAPKYAGNYKLVVSIADTNTQYEGSTEIPFTISKKDVSISGLIAADRLYDGTKTISLSGGTLNGVIGNDLTIGIPTSGTMADPDVGNSKAVKVDWGLIVAVPVTFDSYTFKDITGVTANITKATGNDVTVSQDISVANKTYDGQPASYSGTLKITINGQVITPTAGDISYEWQDANGQKIDAAPSDAGSYKLKVSVNNANYETSKTYDFKIAPKAITVKPADAPMKIGDTVPAFTLEYSGLIEKETLKSDAALKCRNNGADVDGTKAGTYDIVWTNMEDTVFSIGANGGKPGNYTVTRTSPGKLTVGPLSIIQDSLTEGGADNSYRQVLKAGGVNSKVDLTWTIKEGSLPDGLKLDEETGVISGKTTKAGAYKFTVGLTDEYGNTAEKAFSIKVAAAGEETTSGVKTGDDSNMMLWSIMALIALCGAGYTTYVFRNKRRNN